MLSKEEVMRGMQLKPDVEAILHPIISNYGNDVYAVFGMSMGGVLTATIWENKRLNIETLKKQVE